MQNIDLSNLSVLIIDKNPLLRTVFRQVLRELGATDVEVVSNPDTGFETFQSQNPDVVLIDWSPGCDGLDLLGRIRNDPESANPYVPVIITSANTEAEAVVSARDMGMSEFLAKPVSAEALYRRIARVVWEPRAFIKTGAFFGPDRRRRAMDGPTAGRREGDQVAGAA